MQPRDTRETKVLEETPKENNGGVVRSRLLAVFDYSEVRRAKQKHRWDSAHVMDCTGRFHLAHEVVDADAFELGQTPIYTDRIVNPRDMLVTKSVLSNKVTRIGLRCKIGTQNWRGHAGAITECCAVHKEMTQHNMAMREGMGRCRELVIALQTNVGI